MKQHLHLPRVVFALVFAISLQSCNIMYSPSMQNVPLLQEKHEVAATVGLNDLQGAFAVTDHFGVMLNGYFNNGTTSYTDPYTWSSTERKSAHVEAGAGVFKKLNDNSTVEIFGGGGYGNSSIKELFRDSLNAIPSLRNSYSANLIRFFIQPAIGYTVENFDVAFSTRILFQKYTDPSIYGYSPVDLYDNKLLDLDKQVFAFIEPAITMRFGYKYIKFHAQAILSYKYNTTPLNYMPIIINVGFHLDLSKRWNMVKNKRANTPSVEE